jgi:hypothetical protein
MSTREFSSQGEGIEPQQAPLRAPDDPSTSWRWWMQRTIAVVLIAVLVAAVVYLISDVFHARYESSAIVRVSVQTTSGISDPAVTAANDLASQYAQLAPTAPVVDGAAAALGLPSGDLSGAVTAGTVAAQNLVRITATGSSPAQAQARATAVAEAFVTYVTRLDRQQAHAYEQAVTSKLEPLKREIAAARLRLQSANVETQHNASVLLSSLVVQEESVLSSVAGSAAAAQPTLQLVAPGGPATKASPKPELYAAVGFLVTLLLLGRFLYVLGTRRSELRATPV